MGTERHTMKLRYYLQALGCKGHFVVANNNYRKAHLAYTQNGIYTPHVESHVVRSRANQTSGWEVQKVGSLSETVSKAPGNNVPGGK